MIYMKKLKNYEEDIYKCSRCGLCQSVCPVFKTTLNECAVSRGKFNMLNGIIKGELNFSNKIKSYLDLCTGCNACKDFCPSGIDACKIFIAAKCEYYKNKKLSFLDKFFNSYSVFKSLLICANFFYFVYRLFFVEKIVSLFETQLLNMGIIGKRIVLLNSFAPKNIKKTKKRAIGKKTRKAVYFDGCFNKYINSDTKEAVELLLDNTDIELVGKNFECCGVSYLYDGNIPKFKQVLKHNISKLDETFDYVLTDCASCLSVLKEYGEYGVSRESKMFSDKVKSVTELLSQFKFSSKELLNVAVHKPCHDNYDFIDIVKNIKGINYVEAADFDRCCGFSGKFAMQNQEISREISKQKAINYINSNIDIILTTCPACILGLNQGLAEVQNDKKPLVMNLYVFLALYCTND